MNSPQSAADASAQVELRRQKRRERYRADRAAEQHARELVASSRAKLSDAEWKAVENHWAEIYYS